MIKYFGVKHLWKIAVLLSGISFVLGFIFNLWFLFLLGVLLSWGGFGLDWSISKNYEWACPKCGAVPFSLRREKYCRKCGSPLVFRKKEETRFKFCPNGHRIEDKYDLYNFCPKCGEPLERKGIK